MDKVRADRIAKEVIGSEIGRWIPERLIDFGKSAMVFEARSGSEVGALKLFDPELVERFGTDVQAARIQRELALVGKEHPHLVRILDGGQCPRTHFFFIVMELVAGCQLAKALQLLPREQIWPLISQVAAAARFLEQLNLVHRDIKPDNVMTSGDFLHARLLDLGVIRPMGEPGITDGDQKQFLGTLQYSSPEFLFRTEDDTPEGWRALTFYQLGALLHDLIMRRRIFDEHSSPYAALVEAVKNITPIIEAPDVQQDLVLLAKSCLCKDPELRLRLVRWDHFDPPQHQHASLSAVEERILRRQALARGVEAANRLAEMNAQAMQQAREYVRERVQAIVRKTCVGTGIFPPIQVVDAKDTQEPRLRFMARFDGSPDHAFSGCLQIWFDIVLVSQPSMLIRVAGSSSLSTEALDENTVPTDYRMLFEGPFDEGVLGQRIRRFLYAMLDHAQSLGPLGPDGTEWLPERQDEVIE